MAFVRLVVLILHISAAALLVGGSLGLLRNLKKTAALGIESFRVAATDAATRGKVLAICSITTLLTGLALIFLMGGFAVAPKNFHAALGIMLIGTVISATMLKPNTAKLVELSEAATLDQEAFGKAMKKLAAAQGVLHLLWIVNLALMLVRF